MQEGCRIVWKMFIIRVGMRFCSSISSKVLVCNVKIVDISHSQCYNRINYRSQLRPKVRRIAVKLNSRRTILVGLAFLSICTFWQMYDSVMTLILTDTFKLNETFAGAIMAADNVLALFLLPFFGALSDKTSTRIGRRMPFIVGGTAAAAILMNLIPLLDDRYAASPSTGTLVLFIIVLGLLLVSMGTYRSPAVALMPDVTPKPLRSRANAIINLMGAVGGILYLGLAAVLYPASKTKGVEHVSYRPLFFIVSMIMVVAVVVLYLTIKEPKLEAENQKLEAAHPEWNLATDDGTGHEVLPAPVKRSLSCPSRCGSLAITALLRGLPSMWRLSWARAWAGPPPACWLPQRALLSRTFPSVRWPLRLAASGLFSAVSCCWPPALCWATC